MAIMECSMCGNPQAVSGICLIRLLKPFATARYLASREFLIDYHVLLT